MREAGSFDDAVKQFEELIKKEGDASPFGGCPEDVLAAGLYVLDAVMERFEVDELLSSENDILDGITLSLLRT